MDDLIIATNTEGEMQIAKEVQHSQFKMKDMGELHYCLGITIKQDKNENTMEIQQKQYILRMFEKNLIWTSRLKTSVYTSQPNVRLRKDDGVSKAVNPVLYQSMVGSLLYAGIATRPDISHAVEAVSKFSSEPSEAHFTAVRRIFRYLKGTTDVSLKYRKSKSPPLFGYSMQTMLVIWMTDILQVAMYFLCPMEQ